MKRMTNKMKKLFFAITLALCVLLFMERLTGEIFHAVLGVILIVLAAIHLHKQSVKWKHRTISIQAVDWLLMAALAILFVTGILLHPLHGVLLIKILHKLSAVLFVLGVVVHTVQHRSVKKKAYR